MFRILFVLLLVVPAAEIGLLVWTGNLIGPVPTVALIMFTGLLGAWLAKREGMNALRNAQAQLQNGQVPGNVLIDGICILAGGVFLFTPGFISDFAGLLLLFPPTRSVAKVQLLRYFQRKIRSGQYNFYWKR
ncbi:MULTISPECIES: FxsA family protein [Fictibacillus]|uniref:FxsA family protein n=1 Tax=Fictibacillus terranigra TaxID=3058424 RepID=A0ABT8E402_9BACL|nr:FxsA family protein [Fictibacillus sp. CENA-BCM004]MDN4072626.1 FxsA family protein [Fictibacillus sp. CENA-BCM004]